MISLFLYLSIFPACLVAAATSSLGPVVTLPQGSYAGNASFSGQVFFGGIPYAQPPVGDLRWRAPVKLEDGFQGQGVRDARNWGPICIQQPAVVGIGSEDCLTLNVWKPAQADESSKLPVLVYIHGGGNYYGSAQGFPMHDQLIRTNNSIVAVNIQYRLGLLGFLASSSDSNASLQPNAGLLDQRAALMWIKANIAAFGGDPNRVTISGESSGGGSVILQLTAYNGESDPPFAAAIAQSIGNDPFPCPETYDGCFQNATRQIGCSDAEDVVGCLRSASVGAIVSAVNNRGTCKFLPIIDGDFIPTLPSQAITEGRFAKVPFIGGHTTNDGSIFVNQPSAITDDAQVVASITKRYTYLTNATLARMLDLYPLSNFTSQWDRAQQAFADTEFACLDWYVAKKAREAGLNSFNYRWNTPDPVQLKARPTAGVLHTSELFFLFSGTNSGPSGSTPQAIFTPFNVTEAALAQEAVSYWTSFARAFDPSMYNSPFSPLWAGSDEGRLVLEESDGRNGTMTGSRMEVLSEMQEERCKFWVDRGKELRL